MLKDYFVKYMKTQRERRTYSDLNLSFRAAAFYIGYIYYIFFST